MEAQYGKFLDVIRAVRINVPLIDVLAGMPNYGKFLKELISNKHKIEQLSAAFLSDESSAMIQNKVPPKLGDPGSFLIPCNFNKTFSCNALADLGASINLMPYSLYAKLSLENFKPTKMSVRLADRSIQYPVGIAKNVLVEVGKFTFLADFVILEMEEDSKVSLILGRPILHTADAVIRVKQKQLNLRVRTERMIFIIDSTMKHSYLNDDTCFSIDVIDEILEEDFDALLDEGSKILHSIEGTLLEEEIFAEFDEFMAMTADENSDSESDTEDPPFEKITINTDYKIKTSLEEPPTDLELKPLPDNLEYVFLEEPSFLLVIISSQLSKEKKNKLISVLKNHKQAFAWKTTYIPGICPSFCKHKIQLLDDKKPVVQKQRRYFQIPIDPNDQEKTTFTCPFGTYAYRRMPFGLCNAPATFQRCMLAIFHDMIEELVEKRSSRPKLEKVNFIVKEGIVLGHKVSGAGLEVDKAKIDVISKRPPPTNIKVAVDYISKWAKAQALLTNDARVVVTFLKKLFCRFRMPKALISDRGTHFCNKLMEKTMKRYGVNHRFSTSYHPQTSGQVENTNRALKRILEKTVKNNPAIWSRKLDDALWAFRTAYKTLTGTIAEEGESSRGRAFYVPEWFIHRRCRVDTPMWCRELMVHLAPPAAQEEANALNNATALERAWKARDEHSGCAEKLRVVEDQNCELSRVNKDQALRIKELENELARKDSTLVYAKRISAERAQEKEKLVTKLGRTKMEKFDCIRKLLPTLVDPEGHSEEDIMDALSKVENFDPYSDKKMYVEYDKLFAKRYPYVERISHGFRHSVSDLLKIYPDPPSSGQVPATTTWVPDKTFVPSGKAPTSSAPKKT
ncbi:reverse transcriptase domain-containing protein [Tanacetum coccineum]